MKTILKKIANISVIWVLCFTFVFQPIAPALADNLNQKNLTTEDLSYMFGKTDLDGNSSLSKLSSKELENAEGALIASTIFQLVTLGIIVGLTAVDVILTVAPHIYEDIAYEEGVQAWTNTPLNTIFEKNVLADLATVLAAPDKYKLISSIDLGDYKGGTTKLLYQEHNKYNNIYKYRINPNQWIPPYSYGYNHVYDPQYGKTWDYWNDKKREWGSDFDKKYLTVDGLYRYASWHDGLLEGKYVKPKIAREYARLVETGAKWLEVVYLVNPNTLTQEEAVEENSRTFRYREGYKGPDNSDYYDYDGVHQPKNWSFSSPYKFISTARSQKDLDITENLNNASNNIYKYSIDPNSDPNFINNQKQKIIEHKYSFLEKFIPNTDSMVKTTDPLRAISDLYNYLPWSSSIYSASDKKKIPAYLDMATLLLSATQKIKTDSVFHPDKQLTPIPEYLEDSVAINLFLNRLNMSALHRSREHLVDKTEEFDKQLSQSLLREEAIPIENEKAAIEEQLRKEDELLFKQQAERDDIILPKSMYQHILDDMSNKKNTQRSLIENILAELDELDGIGRETGDLDSWLDTSVAGYTVSVRPIYRDGRFFYQDGIKRKLQFQYKYLRTAVVKMIDGSTHNGVLPSDEQIRVIQPYLDKIKNAIKTIENNEIKEKKFQELLANYSPEVFDSPELEDVLAIVEILDAKAQFLNLTPRTREEKIAMSKLLNKLIVKSVQREEIIDQLGANESQIIQTKKIISGYIDQILKLEQQEKDIDNQRNYNVSFLDSEVVPVLSNWLLQKDTNSELLETAQSELDESNQDLHVLQDNSEIFIQEQKFYKTKLIETKILRLSTQEELDKLEKSIGPNLGSLPEPLQKEFRDKQEELKQLINSTKEAQEYWGGQLMQTESQLSTILSSIYLILSENEQTSNLVDSYTETQNNIISEINKLNLEKNGLEDIITKYENQLALLLSSINEDKVEKNRQNDFYNELDDRRKNFTKDLIRVLMNVKNDALPFNNSQITTHLFSISTACAYCLSH